MKQGKPPKFTKTVELSKIESTISRAATQKGERSLQRYIRPKLHSLHTAGGRTVKFGGAGGGGRSDLKCNGGGGRDREKGNKEGM